MLMSAEPKGCVKFHHCRMCVTDFLEEEARTVTLSRRPLILSSLEKAYPEYG